MADQKILLRELTALMGALPRTQLVEVSRRAALGGFQRTCRLTLGDRALENLLASVFGDFPEARLREVAREMGLTAIRNAVWRQLLALPGQWKVKIRCPDREAAEALRARKGPVILAFWHMGAANMLPLGLHAIGVPALVISTVPASDWLTKTASPEMKVVVAKDDPKQSAIALKQALDRLRKGGVAALAIDGSQGTKDVALTFLGRQYAVSRGVAVLARLTGAPIVPCIMTWSGRDWGMSFRIFKPLSQPARDSMSAEAFELAVLTTAVQRFEKIAHALPGQLWIDDLAGVEKSLRLASAA